MLANSRESLRAWYDGTEINRYITTSRARLRDVQSLFENVLPPTACSRRVNDRGFPPNLSAVLERLLPENPDEDAASSYQNNSWPSLDVDADEDDAPGGHGG